MRKIVPAILLISCLLLAGFALKNIRPRSQSPSNYRPEFNEPFTGGIASPAERAQAISSIAAQLNDFRRDDYKRAAYYQSPTLQASVGGPEQFKTMITTAYPEFAHSTQVRYGDAESVMGGLQVNVPVSVTGRDGITVNAVYRMNRGPDGVYRVAGVEMAPP